MKFQHSLQVNSVPEWKDHYIDYAYLKDVIYELQSKIDEFNSDEIEGNSNSKNSKSLKNLKKNLKFLKSKNKDKFNKNDDDNNGKSYPANPSLEKLNRKSPNFFFKNVNPAIDRIKNLSLPKPSWPASSNSAHTQSSSSTSTDSLSKATNTDTDDNDTTGGDGVELQQYNFEDIDEDSENPKKLNFDHLLLDNITIKDLDLQNDSKNPKSIFYSKLNNELNKIDAFYSATEKDLFIEVEALLKDLQHYSDDQHSLEIELDDNDTNQLNKSISRSMPGEDHRHVEDEEDDYDDAMTGDIENDAASFSSNTALLNERDLKPSIQHSTTFRKRVVTIFIKLSEIKSFIELNKMGFSKVCKKFDKVLNESIRDEYMESLPSNSYIFKLVTISRLDDYIDELIKIYASLTNSDIEHSKENLKTLLRDHIIWERSKVWKGYLNNINGFNVEDNEDLVDDSELRNLYSMPCYKYKLPVDINLPYYYNFNQKKLKSYTIGYLKLPKLFLGWRALKIAITILVTGLLLGLKSLHDTQQKNCMALVICCAILWATEAIPLFTTSMLVPFLVVILKVLKADDGSAMDTVSAATYIFSTMWNSTIMILIAGFTLAAALSKYNIAKVVSSWVLASAGTSPKRILLAVMGVSMFLSMWISNVAAPVLTYSLCAPLLKSIPTESGFAKALVLGVALASDVAGVSSPISSPQNVIAIQVLTPAPGWGDWFAVSIPLSVIGLAVVWVEMILTFNINTVKLKKITPIREKFCAKQLFVCAITILTIILWCVSAQTEDVFGSTGIIACIPIIVFYGTSILSPTDINSYPWSIVILAMGGIALGKAVTSSGLLHLIATSLQEKIGGYPPIAILAIFGALCLVFATFVSHTVSALIIVPLVQTIGREFHHEGLMVIGIALIASVAMGMPSSGFPNSIAISMTDDLGKRYLTANHFITRGVIASFIMYGFIITVGYGILISKGY
ncbi:hypothetical protein BVG19_g4811 [[Candida] boidinii]|nr:hypothetical protein BVG19_g4811 [[Candida] boidinii]OWB51654.1 hypothetical protein B5S27_g3219 [[Candida] boidinii]